MQRYRLQRTAQGAPAEIVGPLTARQVRVLVEQSLVSDDDLIAVTGGALWLPATAWSIAGLEATPPPRHLPERLDLPLTLEGANEEELMELRWWLRSGGSLQGPLDHPELVRTLAELDDDRALLSLPAGDCWFPAIELIPEVGAARSEGGFRAEAASASPMAPCAFCLESIPVDARKCPECGEAQDAPASVAPSTSRPGSIPDDPPDAGWLRMHWRPLLTMSAVAIVLVGGLLLRQLAPERYQPPSRLSPAAAVAPTCDDPCWHGEACQLGQCVFQPSNDHGHVGDKPHIAGPFELPPDVMDVLALDAQRFAVSFLRGVQVNDARTGAMVGLISDAPQSQRLHRVGNVIYASSPQRIYVIDAASTRVLKSIELGGPVGEVSLGAAGRRVLASLPTARAVAVIATDYHAEVSRFYFGDDQVGPVAIDDSGERALTTNGDLPLPGLPASKASRRAGATYAFDPSRLPTEQDRVRAALLGNPVAIAMIPDGKTSYVVLRSKNQLVRLEHQPSGEVSQADRVATCEQPEHLGLARKQRRLIIGCNAGRAIEIVDVDTHGLVRRIPLGTRVADLAVTPDGSQALLALPQAKEGVLAVLDLESFELQEHQLTAPPDRIRMSPDGKSAVVVSNRSKVAWVIR